ncbi:MAG TPA: hypothetical protein VK712_04575 [Verrucomicrobiae bacterium]|jgi:hypothetical protein|nr:hypothetical protein [Verrucomicrobiae bacterium]
MSPSRVEVVGGIEFSPREWLRREVLWASLITPYHQQMHNWLTGAAFYQYSGNGTREGMFEDLLGSQSEDIEAQARVFFNEGKKATSIISSAVLFRIFKPNVDYRVEPPPLEVQAAAIDKVLNAIPADSLPSQVDDVQAYKECTRLAIRLNQARPGQFGNRRMVLNAARIMTELATAGTASWIASSRQNEERSLPLLVIPNGGDSRSSGPNVEMFQPVLHRIVASEAYQALRADL